MCVRSMSYFQKYLSSSPSDPGSLDISVKRETRWVFSGPRGDVEEEEEEEEEGEEEEEELVILATLTVFVLGKDPTTRVACKRRR